MKEGRLAQDRVQPQSPTQTPTLPYTHKIDVKNEYLNTSNLKVPINDSQDARLTASPDFKILPACF